MKTALISVSDKTNLIPLAEGLRSLQFEIISTGGTAQHLREANIPVRDITSVTEFPEMMEGRVKTLHPKIHAGILGKRNSHQTIADQHQISWIDLVFVNLYPFAATIKKSDVTEEEVIENIDIGGPALIRSAAKNHDWVGVIVDPNDYENILQELKLLKKLSDNTRKKLAIKAFQHTADYDSTIANYFSKDEKFIRLKKKSDLRYGENPHQTASAYQFSEKSILSAKELQGKSLSFNNLIDADAAFACVREFKQPACVIVKHNNPCGAALAFTIEEAFDKAFSADSLSAFGGIIALNQECTLSLAEKISQHFFEVLIAPGYEKEALAIFSNKPNLRVLQFAEENFSQEEFKFVTGGVLIQEKNSHLLKEESLQCVTTKKPTATEISDMLFAWPIVKHLKSNAIVIAKDKTTMGLGAGQVSRIDAVEIALKKAGEKTQHAVLATEAFFPFRDSIDRLAKTGIRAIIQPGGSRRDNEVIAACNELEIAMIFTNVRCFKH